MRGALCDDLNTPQAVSALSAPLKALNDLLHTKKVPQITLLPLAERAALYQINGIALT